MSRENISSKEKNTLIKQIKKSKLFSADEIKELEQEIKNINEFEEIDYLLANSKYKEKLQEVFKELGINVFYNTLYYISCNPIYHSVAMEHSIKYQTLYNNLSDKFKKKLARQRDVMYHLSKGHTYILLFIAYCYTFGIAYIFRRLYINKKKKEFLEYLNSKEFDEMIDVSLNAIEDIRNGGDE